MRQNPWLGIARLFLLTSTMIVSTGCGTAEKICIEGEEVPYDDNCGVCVCKYGAWSCTVWDECKAGTGGTSGSGGSASGGRGNPSSGGTGTGGSQGVCTDNTTKSDGCNACVCLNGSWSCTDNECAGVCSPGTRVEADCGTCSCDDNSEWVCPAGCSVKTCQTQEGVRCTDKKSYCHYPDNALCGLTGAGICKVRPSACDGNYDPVCGCDGKTYSNSCEAASKGVTVILKGECTLPR